MDKKSIVNQYIHEIVCPFCGYEFNNSFEYGKDYNEDLGLIECEDCGKEFYAVRHISISYNTIKAKYGTCKKCNAKNVVLEDYYSSIGKYKDLCSKCAEKTMHKLRHKALISIYGQK